MINRIWRRITQLGVSEEHSDENSLTMLYNKVAFFSVTFLVIFSGYLYITPVPLLFFYITLGISFIYALILVFNGLNKIYWARLCTSLGTVTWVSIYHVCFEGFISQSLAVGAAIIINYVAFRKKTEYMKLLFAVHAGIYLLALIYGINFEPIVELVDYPIAGLVSFIVSMSWVTLFLIVFHQERESLIAGLKRKNQELEQTTKELDRFSYIASHDLKSPLRTIISFGGLIQRDIRTQDFEQIGDRLDFLMSSAQQMNYIVEGILELSQIKSIDEEDKSEVDLNRVLEKAKLNLKDEIIESKAVVQVAHLPAFFGNEIEFLLLFQNIIQNAIKYNKSEIPVVEIFAREEEEMLFLSFRDNGIGIDAKYFSQIFEFFQRLHNVSEYPGTGIGLGICKRIVEKYNGSICVESTIGRGATFTVQLPVVRNGQGRSSQKWELVMA